MRYLESSNPICYNGLRDIGIYEAEAFSAISIIEAYLDAYELTNDNNYLENALYYAYYTLTWFYFYNLKNLKLSYNFHPISQSITPRLSPYENLLIISTYRRLADITKDKIWTQYADATYKETIKWISENGGLCEGIFPKFLTGLQPLPMEQTFATIELLSAASNYFHLKKRTYKKTTFIDRNIIYKKEGNIFIVKYNKKEILKFDVNKF